MLENITPIATPVSPFGNTNIELVLGMVLFIIAGFGMVFAGLLIGKVVRPAQPHPQKETTYECGE
jgi:NADH:ubiquinone oxidoreductase subunit 3 (subunit A)